jgi:hypothetical protein
MLLQLPHMACHPLPACCLRLHQQQAASWLMDWLLQELRCPHPAGLLAALRCKA